MDCASREDVRAAGTQGHEVNRVRRRDDIAAWLSIVKLKANEAVVYVCGPRLPNLQRPEDPLSPEIQGLGNGDPE